MIIGAEEDARGIGQAGGQGRQTFPGSFETRKLLGVERVVGLLGNSQMAHQPLDVDTVEQGRVVGEPVELGVRSPQPRYARVDMEDGGQAGSVLDALRGPGGDGIEAVEHRQQAGSANSASAPGAAPLRHANGSVALRFGLPAVMAAFGGAGVLVWLSRLPTVATYEIGGVVCEMTAAKLIVAVLMFCFALWEVLPVLSRVSFGPRALPVGGLLSGFFGGVSGHQGALRSAFLLKCGLTKEAFIATGVAIACLVDVARLVVYSGRFVSLDLQENGGLLLAATVAAMAGALIGTRLVHKVTIGMIRGLVSVMLFALAGLMAAGVI